MDFVCGGVGGGGSVVEQSVVQRRQAAGPCIATCLIGSYRLMQIEHRAPSV